MEAKEASGSSSRRHQKYHHGSEQEIKNDSAQTTCLYVGRDLLTDLRNALQGRRRACSSFSSRSQCSSVTDHRLILFLLLTCLTSFLCRAFVRSCMDLLVCYTHLPPQTICKPICRSRDERPKIHGHLWTFA